MGTLLNLGRIFYGIVIMEMGLHVLYYHDFPYMLLPPKHSGMPGLAVIAAVSGILLVLAGACIVFEKKTRPAALLLGSVLLLIFCFYFIPYQLMVSPNYMHFGDWENAAKELALCSGAYVIAGGYPQKGESPLFRFLAKPIPFGSMLFAITIISFSFDHFLYANEAADYVPSWVPAHVFWIYFTGLALLASGIAIILNIKRKLAATLLGAMILTWFVILHIPRIVVSPLPYLASEITSAGIALAYSGIAFIVAAKSPASGTSLL
ncbi:hypothetical protein SAMN04488109_0227 [Chryseolinea serpens]|uniref:DoxX protein n=1 Tax=Chryseolinea serpens TaxID=947013 RepID=A0A1M5JRA3_9BACT|nr:hypothetical protein [Chryseolinea serpens]SHG42810.1 hypothetical protein SAMN04488109_0227 [Chryseolinea serpens]